MHRLGRMRRRGAGLVLAVGLLAAGLLAGAGVAVAAPTRPTADPFYRWTGSLTNLAPGAVLRTRSVEVNGGGTSAPYAGLEVLYRTTDQLGQPSATVATVIKPAASLGVKLLSYQTFYDGVADTCRPSYTLQNGSGSPGLEEGLMLPYLNQGYTIVTSDYEGETDDFGAGRESGQGTLDAIRAAEHVLGVGSEAPVGLIGYSGGSIASEWASELQPSYAPELHLIGVAEGGIPVDFTHTLHYIDGSSDWAGAIPAVGIGLARAYRIDFTRYLSPYGAQVAAQVEQGCINEAGYPGLTFEKMLKPQYQDWEKVPIFVRIFNDSIMGRTAAPREPLLMRVGNRGDGGDGVMIAGDVQQLAHEYCTRGVTVDFEVYNGDTHYTAAVPFEAEALTFLDARYAGLPATNRCSQIPAGNPLTPLPPAPTPPVASPHLRFRGLAVERREHGIVVGLSSSGATATNVTVELTRNRKLVCLVRLAHVGAARRRVVLRVRAGMPPPGRYVLLVLIGRHRMLRHGIAVPR